MNQAIGVSSSRKTTAAAEILKIEQVKSPFKTTEHEVKHQRFILHLKHPMVKQVQVSGFWVQEHQPVVGGYYLAYRDGKQGYEPSHQIEEICEAA